jgi:EAL domain-containing protein (putative c-di-GMP-specific phosphodiesterase class I)
VSDPYLLGGLLEPGRLSVVCQPVFEVGPAGHRLHAIECLTRGPAGTNMEDAEILFEYVRRKREESLFDRACVAAALRELKGLPGAFAISLNVHASTLGRDHGFTTFVREMADQYEISLLRLTVEVVEHTPYWDGPSFLRALETLRLYGVSIALDDIGVGHSNYRMMLDCRPDYFKIDRYLITGCDRDPGRQAVLRSVIQLAASFGSRLVAEGVERREELACLLGLGVDLVQGFLLARPMTTPELVRTFDLTAATPPPALLAAD